MPIFRNNAASTNMQGQELLSSDELLAGTALRVVDCVGSEFDREAIDVRLITCLKHRHDLVVTSVCANALVGRNNDIHVTMRNRHDVACPKPWARAVEEEYTADIPKDSGDLVLKVVSGGKKLACITLTKAKRIQLLEDHFERVQHPFLDDAYPAWLELHRKKAQEWRASHGAPLNPDSSGAPLFSIVCPLYHTPEHYLREMLDSVLTQTYPAWELILVNASPDDNVMASVLASYQDPRIRVLDHPENDGINGNTNAGIELSMGDYVAFVDHDDTLDPHTLEDCARVIAEHPDTDVIYTDEDSFDDEGKHFLPMFKPEYSHDLLLSNDYSLHFEVISRRVLEQTERSGEGTSGAQDYDLMLKATEHSCNIVRIPHILYHWRAHEGSTNAGNTESKPYVERACEKVIGDHLRRLGHVPTIVREPTPFTFKTLITPKAHRNVTVVVDSSDRRQFALLRDRLSTDGVDFLRCRQSLREKSLPALRNAAAQSAKGNLLLFVSAGDEPFTENFLDVMRSYLERAEVGLVVPELLFPGGLRVDSGWVLCADGGMTHMNQGIAPWDGGYNGRACRPCQWTVANPAIQLVRREEFLALGGYAEDYYTLDYASADLCMRYREAGLLVTYTPFAAAFHSEPSQTPYALLPQAVLDAQEADRERFRSRWLTDAWVDPSYNPNLDPKSPYFKLRW